MERCREILQHGLSTMHLSDDNKIEILLQYLKLIVKWNQTYNLTAIKEPEEIIRLHFLDSLTVLPFLQGNRVIDIGTGAGFPGIPLAIFLPEKSFTLLDANAKKTRFVQQAVMELNLSHVNVQHSRAEQFQPQQRYSTVIMRAFANLEKIMRLTAHLTADDGIVLAMKGRVNENELAQLSAPYRLIPVTVPELNADRCLVRIERSING